MAIGYRGERVKNLPSPTEPSDRFPRGKYKGVIAKWHPNKLIQFERDIIAQTMSLREIGKKYGVSGQCVADYRDRTLKPAIKMARSNEDTDIARAAREHMDWVFGEIKDSVDEVKGRKVDADGNAIKGDPKIHGNVIALLGLGIKAVEVVMPAKEQAAQQAQAANAQPSIVNIISIPKAPGTPERGKAIAGAVDYSKVKVLDLEPESSEQV